MAAAAEADTVVHYKTVEEDVVAVGLGNILLYFLKIVGKVV